MLGANQLGKRCPSTVRTRVKNFGRGERACGVRCHRSKTARVQMVKDVIF